MSVFSFFRFLFSATILAIWLPWMSSVSAWKSCDFSIYINFFSILSILVASLSTLCCTMSSFSFLFLIPSIDDVILVRVAIISFKVSSCCCWTSASWLFWFMLLLWFFGSTVLILLTNGYYWICISVEVQFNDFHYFCNDDWVDWFGFRTQVCLMNCYTSAICAVAVCHSSKETWKCWTCWRRVPGYKVNKNGVYMGIMLCFRRYSRRYM